MPQRNRFAAGFKLQLVDFAEKTDNCAAARVSDASEKMLATVGRDDGNNQINRQRKTASGQI